MLSTSISHWDFKEDKIKNNEIIKILSKNNIYINKGIIVSYSIIQIISSSKLCRGKIAKTRGWGEKEKCNWRKNILKWKEINIGKEQNIWYTKCN